MQFYSDKKEIIISFFQQHLQIYNYCATEYIVFIFRETKSWVHVYLFDGLFIVLVMKTILALWHLTLSHLTHIHTCTHTKKSSDFLLSVTVNVMVLQMHAGLYNRKTFILRLRSKIHLYLVENGTQLLYDFCDPRTVKDLRRFRVGSPNNVCAVFACFCTLSHNQFGYKHNLFLQRHTWNRQWGVCCVSLTDLLDASDHENLH